MLQNQIKSDDAHYDLPLIYDVNGHHLHFGRRQFHLITGFKFGMPSFRKFRTGDIIFRDRVFPEKVGVNLKAIDLLCLIEEDEYFIKLSDEDAVRVCLLLSAQVIFMGREMLSVVDDVYLRMVENVENWNDFHWGEHIWRQLYDAIRNTYSSQKLEYSLAGFVFAFKIWILEVSTQSLRWWSKELDLIPRALSWSKKAKEINHDLYPTRAESDTEWYTKGIRFFNWYAPRPSPAVNRGGLFEDYLCKRAALRAKIHAIDNEVPAPQASYTLQDRVRTLQGICNGFMLLPAEVNSLRSRVHKLETYIQAGHRQDKLHRVEENEQRLDKLHNVVEKEHKEPEKDKFDNDDKDAYIADEYCPNLNHNFLNLFESEIQNEFLKDEKVSEKDVEEEDCVYLATQERLAAEKQEAEIRRVSAQREERLRVLKEQEKTVYITNHIFKAPHMQLAFQNCGSKKRQHTLVLRPEFKDVDDDVNLPTLDQLKRTIWPLTPDMIQKCKDLKPWQEDLKRPSKRIDKVFVDRQLEVFITNNGQPRCKFPWCNDIIVDHHFWDCFVGMDETREGWLRDELRVVFRDQPSRKLPHHTRGFQVLSRRFLPPTAAVSADVSPEIGDNVPLFANIVGSLNNPSETYQYYDLPFCHPGQVIPKKETLREVLNGDRLTNTIYELRFHEDEVEQVLCNKKLKRDDITKFRDAIMNDFYFQMYYDDLPFWGFIGKMEDESWKGDGKGSKYYLFKHVHFDALYNGDQVIEIRAFSDPNHVVDITNETEIIIKFTYSIKWNATSREYKNRMNKYSCC
ncbi:Nonaspanin (TM9SF) [Artemisia annua]|uniref:Transmembrane 9 superfamily member n=1 Tax=Artemisia annua TaxID=35608 RepID=A0A2U1M1A1_ARTAN|nr:Nonaspanin (TM9SF) [Artemisia annua]